MQGNKGSIRIIIGFLLALGAVGTLDMDPQASILVQVSIALVGLGVMASGVATMNSKD